MDNQQRSLEKGTFNDYPLEGEYTLISGNTEQLLKTPFNFISIFPEIECVYAIWNKITKKYYIGSTINLKNRIFKHLYELKNDKHHSNKLQRSFNKYGQLSFIIKILSFDKKDEYDYIKFYNSFENGYNMTDHCYTTNEFKLTEEQIKKAIENKKKKIVALDINGNYIKTFNSLTEAAKEFNVTTSNLSKCLKGKIRHLKNMLWVYLDFYDPDIKYSIRKFKRTEEHNRKISNGLKNKKKTKEHIEKIAKKQGIKVGKFDINNNLIENYYSIKDAGRKNNIHFSIVSRKIKNKTPFGEYYFKIIEDIV